MRILKQETSIINIISKIYSYNVFFIIMSLYLIIPKLMKR